MRDRRFGVEIEFGSRQVNYTQVRELLRRSRLFKGASNWGNNVGHDGSGIEVRSPILQGKDGFKQLETILHFLREDCGGYVTRSDGLHVHHDAPEFVGDFDAIVRLVKSWSANQEVIKQMVHPARTYAACPRWTRDYITALEQVAQANPAQLIQQRWGRRALNIDSLREHGTIEIRQHEGTLDFDKAKSWIEFGQHFIESALNRKRPIPCADAPDVLLKRVRVPKKSSERLLQVAGLH